jgi:predicted ester cyclase
MSTEANKATARRMRETLDQSKGTEGVEEYYAPNSVFHFPGSPPLDREQLSAMSAMFYAAFPDLNHTFEDQIAEGDKVMSRVTFRGKHQGEFQGIPATGKEVAFGAILIDRYEDGKVVEHWTQMDTMGLMQQLGVIPTPEA